MDNKPEVLLVTFRELTYLVVIFVFSLFLVFTGGYFLGKKNALEELVLQYDDECFAEKINQSFSVFSEAESHVDTGVLDEEAHEDKDDKSMQTSAYSEIENSETNEPEAYAYAQLCGFGSREAAQKYGNSLLKRGVEYQILERKSKSKKGKRIIWYQVATEKMPKKNLLNLIEKISKEDRLGDINIIEMEL